MKYFVFAIIVMGCISGNLAAAQDSRDVCTGILTYTGRDETAESKENKIASDLYTRHCEGGSAKSSSQTTVGIEAVVKAIPIKFNLGTGSNDERLNSFCKNYQENYSSYSKENMDRSTVVRESLQAFSDCVNMISKDIYFAPKMTRTQVAIEVRRGGEPASIQGITYDHQKMTCMLPPTPTGPATQASASSYRSLEQAYFPIICERKAKTGSKGAEDFPRADVSIATNRGVLLLPIPEDSLMPASWSSDIKSEIVDLKAKMQDLKNENAKQKAQISALENRRYSLKFTRGDGVGWGADQALECKPDEVAFGNDFTAKGKNANQMIVYCKKIEIEQK